MNVDRRTRFSTDRVAAEELRGTVMAPEYVEPWRARVCVASTFLYAAPGGHRDREIVFGDHVDLVDELDGWSFGRRASDGYCGWARTFDLGPDFAPTHAVRTRHTHVYPRANLKQPPVMRLPFGAGIVVEGLEGRWAATPQGWIFADHLRLLSAPMSDPVGVAELFLGTPYLWSGNTGTGIDCSGLVQMACLACGIVCPGDTDQQEASLGFPLAEESELRRGDLVFWEGHVAWVADAETLLHATAGFMAVVHEPLAAAIERIETQGDGAVTSMRRL